MDSNNKELSKDEVLEEIFNMREQNMTYERISVELKKMGIKMALSTVSNNCKKIYRKKGKEEPKTKRGTKRKFILEEEIYDLKSQGMCYQKIQDYYKNKNINISFSTIRKRLIEYCDLNNKEVPKGKTKIIKKPKVTISDEEIFNLREQRLSYNKISKIFTEKGYKISAQAILNRCKKIYEKKGLENPKRAIGQYKRIPDKYDEEIFNLREQLLNYQQISDKLKEKNIIISPRGISKRCKVIYELKGKKEPVLSVIKISTLHNVNIPPEELFKLREKGYSYEVLADHYSKQGLKISWMGIRRKCKKIYAQKGLEEPVLQKGRISFARKEDAKKALLNLRKTRNATDEQLKQLADLYDIEIDLDKDKDER